MNMDLSIESMLLTPNWYVLHTKSRFEKVVADGLVKKAFEIFLPKTKVKSRRKDRKRILEVPLFPGYVFIKTILTPDIHLHILKTAGVVRLIGTQKMPVPVPEDKVDALKIMIASGGNIHTGTDFRTGDPVMVVFGPFTGIKGVFARYGREGRVIVYFDALGQYAACEVNEADIEILPEL